jgi:hypothetical protein
MDASNIIPFLLTFLAGSIGFTLCTGCCLRRAIVSNYESLSARMYTLEQRGAATSGTVAPTALTGLSQSYSSYIAYPGSTAAAQPMATAPAGPMPYNPYVPSVPHAYV